MHRENKLSQTYYALQETYTLNLLQQKKPEEQQGESSLTLGVKYEMKYPKT